ncbi:hypothetical protein CMT62_13030 [Elizabethkingia anophelis]|uniref:hypothetical protein n=1 Tax=Elizabethkingia anophelis TaxID=1117645 RepID=UPI0024076A78|nr:hypothetical protein [Elizabethkingia anophelis]MDV3722932.1 hypothetical protein [Elizabethkingia anophelis]MDV3936139.1 hypothetical protein [Elizabethkingia anophelis]MDV3960875.1 hypothetical protein [Elizabethkingia anophelis]MDV3965363.1 hypothetical protein [Elizabethkingia anophelis]MDV3972652.1 hypothetical protein [Elizabethkingia anophelis]
MSKLRPYKDSKEFPLSSYERIESTGDYFYMLKGYDANPDDDVEGYTQESLKEAFEEIVSDYIISINHKDMDFVYMGKIQAARMDKLKYDALANIITKIIKLNELSEKSGIELEDFGLSELLTEFQIKKSKDLHEQLQIINERIEILDNEINENSAKLDKEKEENNEQLSINDVIAGVELILEISIDMQKTSLYIFGKKQEQAKNKIDQLTKINSKR